MISPQKIFETGLQYHHYANTAYPLKPTSFKQFRIKNQDEYRDFLKQQWAKTNELSLYAHVPLCTVRCRFCEYVVLEKTENSFEDFYVSLLLKEIEMYREILQDKKILGFDLGGGTPTKLSVENLEKITFAIKNSFNFLPEVELSIETTPAIAAKEPEKILATRKMGYKRMSMGVQTVSERLLNELGREGTLHIYEKAVKNIRKAGFEKFNIDLMYGFLHQSDEDFENTIHYAIALKPDYITLYRNRYKGTKLENEAGGVSLYKVIRQYRLAFELLNKNGYYGNVGKNTFSKISGDYGTSDYLTKRVIEGVPYVGLGLGAQSFGVDYLAYNDGAASKKINIYKKKIEANQFPIQDLYHLDIEETIAKMVSVAFYFGFIDFEAFKKRFNLDFEKHFEQEVKFVIDEGFMEVKNNRLYLTERGGDYINGIIPLFYSKRSKNELIELYENSKNKVGDGEKIFLSAYNIENFKRPSVATDIVALIEKPENKQSVILIKRAEHPFMNAWALPGGFVHEYETVEQTAKRELYEETGLKNVELQQFNVFSKPNRDPRGWIISVVFIAKINLDRVGELRFADDAIDVQIFDIELIKNNDIFELVLKNDDTTLSSKLKTDKENNFTQTENNRFAFDHAEILATALKFNKFSVFFRD